jgi:hypothetical protein
MKEVKYMAYAGYMEVPSLARKLYDEREMFRKNLTFLDQIAQSYNKVVNKANGPEQDLLAAKMSEIEKIIEDGVTKIKWSDPGMKPISLVYCQVDIQSKAFVS